MEGQLDELLPQALMSVPEAGSRGWHTAAKA